MDTDPTSPNQQFTAIYVDTYENAVPAVDPNLIYNPNSHLQCADLGFDLPSTNLNKPFEVIEPNPSNEFESCQFSLADYLEKAEDTLPENVIYLVGEEVLTSSDIPPSTSVSPDISTDGVSTSNFDIKPHIPASLPASENFPGRYNFDILFEKTAGNNKKVSWVFSSSLDKLFVQRNSTFPINVKTNGAVPEGAIIRTMALFSSAECASKVVQRCIDHSTKEIGVVERDHFIRCESVMSVYERDLLNQYNVTVPFEQSHVGQDFSSYLFKCSCSNSCPGLDRKNLKLVFSLEKNNEVLGRRALCLKVCSCPQRDKEHEESKLSGPKIEKKVKRKKIQASLPEPAKKIKLDHMKHDQPDGEDYYTIRIKGRKGYEFLTQMKEYFEMKEKVESIPMLKNQMEQFLQNKGLNMDVP